MAIALSEKQIKDGWQIVKFGEIARNISERVEPSVTDLEVYVGLEHLDPQSLRISRRGVPADVKGQKLRVRPGQIIFGKRRAYQKKLAVADFDGICSAHAMVLEELADKIIPGLLPFFMQSDMFMDRAVAISEGSLSPTIKWKALAIQKFPLPPIESQKEILEVLEKVEECSLNVLYCVQATKELYKHLLLNFFPNFFEKHSNSYQEFPTGWKQVELGKLLVSTPESGYSANEVAEQSDKYVLNLNCLSRNGFVNNGYKSISQKDFIAGNEVLHGDFLISRSNTKELVGAVGIYSENDREAIFPDTMWRLKLKKKLILPEFLEIYLLSPYGRRQIVRIAAGTSGSMVKINKRSLNNLPVPIPSVAKQKQITSVTSALKNNWKNLDRQQKSYLSLRQRIFNNSFCLGGVQ